MRDRDFYLLFMTNPTGTYSAKFFKGNVPRHALFEIDFFEGSDLEEVIKKAAKEALEKEGDGEIQTGPLRLGCGSRTNIEAIL
jgi:hypothetical protein